MQRRFDARPAAAAEVRDPAHRLVQSASGGERGTQRLQRAIGDHRQVAAVVLAPQDALGACEQPRIMVAARAQQAAGPGFDQRGVQEDGGGMAVCAHPRRLAVRGRRCQFAQAFEQCLRPARLKQQGVAAGRG